VVLGVVAVGVGETIPDDRTSFDVIDVVGAALPVIEPGPSTVGGVVLVHPVTTTSPATADTASTARRAPRNPRITLLPDGFPPLASGTPSTTDRADTLTICDDPRARRERRLWITAPHNGHHAPARPPLVAPLARHTLTR
jgi:hypothetical protein